MLRERRRGGVGHCPAQDRQSRECTAKLFTVVLPVAGNTIVFGHQQPHHIFKSRKPFLNGETLALRG